MSSTDGGEPRATATASPSVATAGPAIAMVNLKLPPFWSSDPEVWFQQVKAQFRMRHVTVQRTKFDHVVASLSPDFATEVRDLIIQPPADAPNDSLREQLIKRTTASEQRKLQRCSVQKSWETESLHSSYVGFNNVPVPQTTHSCGSSS